LIDKILLINYDYPPTLAGVRRLTKMAQYLPEHDFEPLVLSATPGSSAVLDYEALKDVEAQNYRVWRTSSPDLDHAAAVTGNIIKPLRNIRSRFDLAVPRDEQSIRTSKSNSLIKGRIASFARRALAIPDDRFPWLTTAIPMANHLVRSQAIRYVLTSSYPNCTHLIGLYLKRRYNIHWHADFRDGWTQNPYFANYLTSAHKTLNHWLEREVARHADSITGVSEPIVHHLAELSNRNNAYLLPNGFDPHDLENIPLIEFDKFTLAYTGTMFMQRSPDSFFAAVRGLLDSYPGLQDNFQIIFRSNIKPEHIRMIRELNLDSIVQNWGMGTWKESLSLQKSADALLVLEGESPNSHIMLTQKIFEYIATEKPVLAVAPPGALADLVVRSGIGLVIYPENVFRIKEALFELFLGRMKFHRNNEIISSFTRQSQAADLAALLRSTSHG